MGSNPVGVTTSWGYSSAGRARALQARGHRFEPCCPHHIKKRATLCVVLFLCVGKQHRTRIRRFLRLCALRAPLCPGHTARSLRNASISASLLTSPVVPASTQYPAGSPLFLTRKINCCAFLCVRYSTNRNHGKNMQRFTFMTNVL